MLFISSQYYLISGSSKSNFVSFALKKICFHYVFKLPIKKKINYCITFIGSYEHSGRFCTFWDPKVVTSELKPNLDICSVSILISNQVMDLMVASCHRSFSSSIWNVQFMPIRTQLPWFLPQAIALHWKLNVRMIEGCLGQKYSWTLLVPKNQRWHFIFCM